MLVPSLGKTSCHDLAIVYGALHVGSLVLFCYGFMFMFVFTQHEGDCRGVATAVSATMVLNIAIVHWTGASLNMFVSVVLIDVHTFFGQQNIQ